jgi:hypothetical protein
MDNILNQLTNININYTFDIDKEYLYLSDILNDYELLDDTIMRYTRYLNSNFFHYYKCTNILCDLEMICKYANSYEENVLMDINFIVSELDYEIYSMLSFF